LIIIFINDTKNKKEKKRRGSMALSRVELIRVWKGKLRLMLRKLG
jgi:hypothetical protein